MSRRFYSSFWSCLLLLASFVQYVIGEEQLPLKDEQDHNCTGFIDSRRRPSCNGHEPVQVHIWPQLYSIVDIDEKMGSITYIQWITLVNSLQLQMIATWNTKTTTAAAANESTFLHTTEIWTPDIMLLNAMKTERIASYGSTVETVQVHPDGTAVLSYPNLITQRCHRFDLADFPFDTQRCSARYSSWSYSSGQLSLKPLDRNIRKQFREHSEWHLEEIKPFHSIETFDNALGESFTRDEVIYDFVLRRKPDHYIYTVAIPCFIITTLAIVGLFAPFSSTGERQEKVTLGLNTLLAVTVLLLMIAEEMPRSMDGESQPILSKYILSEMLMIIVATCTTVATMIVHRQVLIQRPNPRIGSRFRVPSKKTTRKLTKVARDETKIWIDSRKMLEDNLSSFMSNNQKHAQLTVKWNRIFCAVDGFLMLLFLMINAFIPVTLFRQ